MNEVVKPAVLEAVLAYYRDPFKFMLAQIWHEHYSKFPEQFTEIFEQGGGPR